MAPADEQQRAAREQRVAKLASALLTDEEIQRLSHTLRSVSDTLATLRPRPGPLHCAHAGNCVQSCARASAKWFVVVCLAKHATGVLPQLLRGKVFSRPSLLLHGVNGDMLQLALFISTFSASYRALGCAIRNTTGQPLTRQASFAIGCAAGLSILIDRNRDRRATAALLLLMKTGHFLGRWALQEWEARISVAEKQANGNTRPDSALGSSDLSDQEGDGVSGVHQLFFQSVRANSERSDERSPPARLHVQRQVIGWLREHAGTILMMLSGCQIVFSLWTMPSTLSNEYRSFLLRFSGIKDRMGASANDFLQSLSLALTQPSPPGSAPSATGHAHFMCQVMHPSTPSCPEFGVLCLAQSYRKALALYLPLSVLGALVFNLRKTMTKCVCLFLMESVTFAAGLTVIASVVVCGALSGLTALIEPSSRRLDLAMYCFPRALEAFWRYLIATQVIRQPSRTQVPANRLISTLLTNRNVSEPLYFSLMSGLCLMMYETQPSALTAAMQKFFEQ
ncbi:hypothetical protein RI367_006348 [Sorochytrium milnesiophthora]